MPEAYSVTPRPSFAPITVRPRLEDQAPRDESHRCTGQNRQRDHERDSHDAGLEDREQWDCDCVHLVTSIDCLQVERRRWWKRGGNSW